MNQSARAACAEDVLVEDVWRARELDHVMNRVHEFAEGRFTRTVEICFAFTKHSQGDQNNRHKLITAIVSYSVSNLQLLMDWVNGIRYQNQ